MQSNELTIIGPAQSPRSLSAIPEEVDHDIVIYGMDGSPKIKAAFDETIDKFYPDRGLDCDAAAKLMQQFDQRLLYCGTLVVPGPLANKFHEELDYPSHILQITGQVFEIDEQNGSIRRRSRKRKLLIPRKCSPPTNPGQCRMGRRLI